MFPHSRLHELPEGIVAPPLHPVVDVKPLFCTKASPSKLDGLFGEFIPLWGEEKRCSRCVHALCEVSSQNAPPEWRPGPYLDVVQHLSEDGALFPSVRLGPVLVAVRGQAFQTLAQAFAVLHLKLLQLPARQCQNKTKHRSRVAREDVPYLVHIPSQLHQQGDGLPHRDSVVDITALQTRLQFGEVPEKKHSPLITKKPAAAGQGMEVYFLYCRITSVSNVIKEGNSIMTHILTTTESWAPL